MTRLAWLMTGVFYTIQLSAKLRPKRRAEDALASPEEKKPRTAGLTSGLLPFLNGGNCDGRETITGYDLVPELAGGSPANITMGLRVVRFLHCSLK